MIVVLSDIRSIYNVGSIFRTADAVGAEKIYLCGITPAPIDRFGKIRPQFAKVSLGAEKLVKWAKVKATGVIIEKLKKDGYKIFAIEQSKTSILYYKTNLSRSDRDRLVLILGGEVKGLPPAILKKADKVLEIPMRGAMVRQAHHPRSLGRGKESLNVSVAFGVIAYFLRFKKCNVIFN
ncbi:MAG: TrmH family RNA methyltransferase [Candidatus Brennerbacteria bacterium]|nr:TrmH family RNA methyltransferase [Candidatus Brennerbacteria bacterium]